MKPSFCNRADLVRALASGQTEPADVADLFGYRLTVREAPPEVEVVSPPPIPSTPAQPSSIPSLVFQPVSVPFWRVEEYQALDRSEESPPDKKPKRTNPSEDPEEVGHVPLAAEHEVLTQLRQLASLQRPSSEIDLDAVIHRLSRGEFLGSVPRRQRRVWGSTLYVLEDRARHLVPYWQDQQEIIEALRRIYPKEGIRLARLEPGQAAPEVYWPSSHHGETMLPSPQTPVLALSDLGCLSSQDASLQRQWLRLGNRFRANNNPALALVPAWSAEVSPSLKRVWKVIAWGADASPGSGARASERAAALSRLLRLVSPLLRLEPELLRALRLVLPSGRGNPGLEGRLWQHSAMTCPHLVAATLKPEERLRLLRSFRDEDPQIRRAALYVMWVWHRSLPPIQWRELVASLDESSQQLLCDPEDAARARDHFTALAEQVDSKSVLPAFAAWIRRMGDRLPKEACRDPHMNRAVHRLVASVRRKGDGEVRDWYDPSQANAQGSEQTWTIHQHGGSLRFGPPANESKQTSNEPVGPRHILGEIRTVSGEIVIEGGIDRQSRVPLLQVKEPAERTFEIPETTRLLLRTDREIVYLGQVVRPSWAHAIGRDRYGLWASLRVGEVEQCLRWIRPGRFWMGSPDEEEGRYSWEGPRHEVHLSRGFWIFDTPCTQGLWEAVMGSNPSRSFGATLPVEQVSWNGVQEFLSKFNERVSGLELSLPTEAQWEYACRAGTATARYHEDLDRIAWYDENSGGKTHPVKELEANDRGLHDMLGNIWEWCADGQRDYAAGMVVDPVGPMEAGSGRVNRGGSYAYVARSARAAVRYADVPGVRYRFLGFRCTSSGT